MDHSTKPIQVYRGKYVESTHDVHIAVVTPTGELLAYYGDTSRLTFARSSMKPLQAVPIVESGAMEEYHLSERELALFCASHSGEKVHREAVAKVLEKLNLNEHHLQCGTHIPRDMASYNELIKAGKSLTPFFSNCSGKHSGMLVGCVKQGLDIDTYRDVTHPYQQQIIDVIANVSDFVREDIMTSVDGCGVPVHRIPLYNLALAFSRLAVPGQWGNGSERRKDALNQIGKAMATYPEMVAGTNRFDTDLMKAFGGRIVAKGGAEGVHCFADKETGIGVALKVGDGNARGTSVASMEVLKQLNIGTPDIWEKLEEYHEAPVLNARKEKIGAIKASFELNYLTRRGIQNGTVTID
ncbi:asparaginase [Oceanobacillus bengalensis]|uniref:Asparaginase n=1 Tax=Oceanobacillus bengalensis TaxID=1435466 RepID=A0A494Z243_9BACI|nr:asparaginase [Oceanobacillus bengalensis]RKQ16553.1 asparaginase [Oceanobacillus bengalensis]